MSGTSEFWLGIIISAVIALLISAYFYSRGRKDLDKSEIRTRKHTGLLMRVIQREQVSKGAAEGKTRVSAEVNSEWNILKKVFPWTMIALIIILALLLFIR
jgi:phosphate/sulfate permease